jgi:hypothetical protein
MVDLILASNDSQARFSSDFLLFSFRVVDISASHETLQNTAGQLIRRIVQRKTHGL